MPTKIKEDFQFIFRNFYTPGKTPYIDYPILAYVDVSDLVSAFAERSVGDELQSFIKILRKRYHAVDNALVPELNFLIHLRDCIEEKYGTGTNP